MPITSWQILQTGKIKNRKLLPVRYYCKSRTLEGAFLSQKIISKRISVAIAGNALLIVLEIAGMVLSAQEFGFYLFGYYTKISNLLSLIAACSMLASLVLLWKKQRQIPKWVILLKYASVCMLAQTFFVVLFLLSPLMREYQPFVMLRSGSFLYDHFLCPILGILLFLFVDYTGRIDPSWLFYGILPTFLYGMVVLPLNRMGILDGPYQFLRVSTQSPLATLAWFVIMLSLSFVFAFCFYCNFLRI